MNLKCRINDVEYENLVQGFNYSEEYNETLDSASIILSNMPKIDILPYDDVFIYDGEYKGYENLDKNNKKYSFYLHLLVDQFTEEMLNPCDEPSLIRYKYKIDLMSETKKLETVQLPNFSITQPLDIRKKKTVWQYLVDIVDLYSPLYKKVNSEYFKTWLYEKKYSLDPKLEQIFSNVYSPDFTLNNPNIKDVLAQLMKTKDMIPVVKDDIITYLDITERKGDFNVDTNCITSIIGSRSSDNHCDSLRRTYSNALSQDNTCKMVEFLGFRNSNSSMLTLENLRLETRYPIYKINKVYMCYYKKGELVNEEGSTGETRIFLCKQDITPLVKLNSERDLLSEDWLELNEEDKNKLFTVEEMAKYKLCTVGYSIGSNYIEGWGTKYNYIKFNFFDQTKSYIENIFTKMDKSYPYGVYDFGYMRKNKDISGGKINVNADIKKSFVNVYDDGELLETSNFTLGMKSLFFEIEYNAFYNGSVIHSKDIYRDDIVMNDNSSASLTLLEQDGIYQKEKVNRFGNKTIQINAIYDSFDQVQPLGSVYNYGGDTDVIIYHREVSINDNVITCVYYGAQDYVLKNYFTSVYAKHRVYNLMPYSESVRRSENVKIYLLLSKDKCYYEKLNNVLNIESQFIDKFFSFYKNTIVGDSRGDFIYNDKINYGYFTYGGNKYASDVNIFTTGYSLCCNLAMYDNVSGGVYIDASDGKLEPELNFVTGLIYQDKHIDFSEEEKNYMRGSMQKWYITSNEETGFSEMMGFYIGHVDENVVFNDKEIYTGEEEDEIKNIIKYKIMALPKINVEDDVIKNKIGNEFKINKDNKELIDMTFQFETLSDSEDILFSSWMLRLSDLSSNFLKFNQDIGANDFTDAVEAYNTISATFECPYYYSDYQETYSDIMILEISDENLSQLKVGPFEANFIFKYPGRKTTVINKKDIIYYKFKSNEIIYYDSVDGVLLLKGTQYFELKNEKIYILEEQIVIFKKVTNIGITIPPIGINYFCNARVDQLSSKTGRYYYETEYFKFLYNDVEYDNSFVFVNGRNYYFPLTGLEDWYLDPAVPKIVASVEKSVYLNETINDENTDVLEIKFKGESIPTIYHKNLFLSFNKEKLTKKNVYDEYESIEKLAESGEYVLATRSLDNMIFVTETDNYREVLRINLKELLKYLPNFIPQSIKIWYDSNTTYENSVDGVVSTGENGLHFVFGVNVTEDDWEFKDYIDIYISMLSRKDRRVYDENHKVVGYIRNEANTGEPLYYQYYEDIS